MWVSRRTAIVMVVIMGISVAAAGKCEPSKTVASGTHAPKHKICSGELIFEENFDTLDCAKWEHESTLGGGGNSEFQWYTNNRSNSFAENGVLKIKPTLTADHLGEAALTSETLDLNGGAPADICTNPAWKGCIRTGNPEIILNPVKSARIRTTHSFSFKYGRVEVSAKMPAGDWLWPAIWMMPRYNFYGIHPSSGEIDIAESRGNRDLKLNGDDIGVQQGGSALHWGPDWSKNQYTRTNWEKKNPEGFDKEFQKYELIWTPDSLSFKLDGQEVGSVSPPADGGFWKLGDLDKSGYENPWRFGTKLAPFDQEFYIIINLAVGGGFYFPDAASNPGGKPWKNGSPKAPTEFWNGRSQWLPTWNMGKNEDSYLQVDYVKVYAL